MSKAPPRVIDLIRVLLSSDCLHPALRSSHRGLGLQCSVFDHRLPASLLVRLATAGDRCQWTPHLELWRFRLGTCSCFNRLGLQPARAELVPEACLAFSLQFLNTLSCRERASSPLLPDTCSRLRSTSVYLFLPEFGNLVVRAKKNQSFWMCASPSRA